VSAAVLAIAAAVPTDVEAIMACERRPGYEDTVGRWSREEHLAGIADPTHRYFVGRDAQDAVAGFVMLQEIDAPAGSVLVRRVAVAEQGRGHGAALLSHALAVIFEEFHAKRARLYVWPHNPRGIALYSKLGMREDGVSKDERDGVRMTIMAIDAETYQARKQRSASP
jgi:ribosomal protein S18 acetylase RimI-like enzyme